MKSANQLQSDVVSGSNPLSTFDGSSTEVDTFLVPFIPRNPIGSSDLNCTLYSSNGSECILRDQEETIFSCTLSSVSLSNGNNTNSASSTDDDCDCSNTDDSNRSDDDDSNDDVDSDSADTDSSDDTHTACNSNRTCTDSDDSAADYFGDSLKEIGISRDLLVL